jgi:deoxyribodipyrimidine photolyase
MASAVSAALRVGGSTSPSKRSRDDIEQLGGQLTVRAGDGSACLDKVIDETGAEAVYWSRRYGAAERETDAASQSAA